MAKKKGETMTDAEMEREARELFAHRVMTDWGNEDPTGKRREIFIGHLIQDITSLCRRVRDEALEEAAVIADTEPELEGDPPREMREAFKKDPVLCLRGNVRATKACISKRIRALKTKEEPRT